MNEQVERTPLTAASAGTQRGLVLLGALAVFLCALLLMQIGRAGGGSPALADLVSSNAEYAILAADAGNSEDVVLVLDQRGETLLLYRCVNQRTVDFKGKTDLRQLFFEARKSGK